MCVTAEKKLQFFLGSIILTAKYCFIFLAPLCNNNFPLKSRISVVSIFFLLLCISFFLSSAHPNRRYTQTCTHLPRSLTELLALCAKPSYSSGRQKISCSAASSYDTKKYCGKDPGKMHEGLGRFGKRLWSPNKRPQKRPKGG